MAFAPEDWNEKLRRKFSELSRADSLAGLEKESDRRPDDDEPSILHIDMDAFFAAVEQRDNPSLRGLPLIIGGIVDEKGARGVVTTCSYEARPYGIHAGMPLSRAWTLCPHGTFIKGSRGKYGSASMEVMALLRRFSPELEPVSIDEAFLNVTRCHRVQGSSRCIAEEIQATMERELGLTCSIGIGSNRLLAKMASKMRKPAGIFELPLAKAHEVLAPMPVSKMHGIGEATTAGLNRLGIHTLGELADFPQEVLIRRFGSHGGRNLKKLAAGLGSRVVKPFGYRREEKSIGQERTFGRDQSSLAAISAELLHLCEKVGHRLRQGDWLGRTLTLRLRDADFQTCTRQARLPEATQCDKELHKTAMALLQRNWQSGQALRLVGVSVSGLIRLEGTGIQGSLLEGTAGVRDQRVDQALDAINDVFGSGSIARCNAHFRRNMRVESGAGQAVSGGILSRSGSVTGAGAIGNHSGRL